MEANSTRHGLAVYLPAQCRRMRPDVDQLAPRGSEVRALDRQPLRNLRGGAFL